MDKQSSLYIKGFVLNLIVGTQPIEREQKQDILVNLEFVYDGTLAAQTDCLSHAVDYASVYEQIIEKTKNTEFFLLEKLAGFILEIVMNADTRIDSAKVFLEKKKIFPQADSVVVSLSAQRGSSKNTIRCY